MSPGEFQEIQVVPDKLTVQIHRHEIPYFEPVPCWTFITKGLEAHRQKEVILTLQRDPQSAGDEPPRFPLEIIERLYHLAEQGQVVDAWGYSYFVTTSLKEKGETIAFYVAYLYPLPLPGVHRPSPALTGIFLNQDDFEVLQAFGLTRLVAARGNRYKYYPCPPWSAFPLPTVVSMVAMQQSILGKVPRIHLQGSTVTLAGEVGPILEGDIVLRLQPKARQILQAQLDKIAPGQPLALLPELDPNANACLAWVPEKNATTMNVPPGSDLSRKAGCYVAFVPEQGENTSRVFEDGFMVMLTTDTWMQIREALVASQPIVVPTKGTQKRFRLEHVPGA